MLGAARDAMPLIRASGLAPRTQMIEGFDGARVIIEGREILNFASSNYLGLSRDPRVTGAAAAALETFGIGSGGSRAAAGNLAAHEELDGAIAEFLGRDLAVSFPAGSLTNIGCLLALGRPIIARGTSAARMTAPGVIFSDERNHASIVYGLRLAGCPVEIYEHNNMDQLAEHLGRYDHEMPKLIVSDGVFSMDGDLAPLADIARLADECGADIYLDDAHGIGVLGATGRGSIEHLGLDAGFDLLMGTYSKAFGGAGGFVAGESEVVEYLRMTSISAIFTAPIPPPTAAGLRVSVGIVRAEPERRERIQRNAALFRALLHENDFNTLDSETHIVPVLVGDDRKTADAVQAMVDRGVFALEGRWPAVRSGYGRLRFTVTALHSEDDIAHAVGVLRDVRDHVGFSDFGAVATG